jgi:Protein of unknown function (DUF1822)
LYELQNQILELGTVRLTKLIANRSSALLVARKTPTANLKFVDMCIDSITPLLQPCPGEIWAISGAGGGERYLMIVHEPLAPKLLVCSGMLFSLATEYLSAVDVLMPIAVTGLEQDVLAETWNVGQVSIDHLVRPVGNRLSRQLYDVLLLIGDGATDESLQRSAEELGLVIDSGADADFHYREQRLLASLSPAMMSWTNNLVTQSIEIERDLIDLLRPRVILSVWLDQLTNSLNAGWQDAADFVPRMAIATRGLVSTDEVANTIAQLGVITDEFQRRELIKKLGLLTSHYNEALSTLTTLVANTQDDETLWVAVDSLRQIEPTHPSLGIRCLKSITLGAGHNFNFVVSMVPKIETGVSRQENQQMGILLQVYPEKSQPFLPANLKLMLQDELGSNLREVVAMSIDSSPCTSVDKCIQLKFSGEVGEAFRVCLILGDTQLSEDFVI